MKFQSGFSAFKAEEERRKKAFDSMKRKLWRFFITDKEENVPVRFLTEEPIVFFEHTFKTPSGGWTNESCIGEGCPHCAEGMKPQWVGAWLVVDGREFDQKVFKDGKDTGTTKKVKDRIKLLVRGMKDVAKLAKRSKDFGLTTRQWFVTRTGTGNTTTWDFERSDTIEKLTPKTIDTLRQQLPAEIRSMDFEDIIVLNIDPDAVWPEATETKETAAVKAQSGVKPVARPADDDEDEVQEEAPKRKIVSFKKK